MGDGGKPLAARVISVRLERKAFGSAEVLGPVSLDIARGECVALLGPSGIGKTTLLRIIAGLDKDFEGSVERPERLAMVFQEPTLLNWRSALQNIMIVAGLSSDAAQDALEAVGLGNKSGLFPDQLSLGQRRRLALARALAVRPDFLIMDEPFASLDPDRVLAMINLTRTLLAQQPVATLFVTHAREEADRLADRILVLSGQPASLA